MGQIRLSVTKGQSSREGSCIHAGNAGLRLKVYIAWLLVRDKKSRRLYLPTELRTNEREGKKLCSVCLLSQ